MRTWAQARRQAWSRALNSNRQGPRAAEVAGLLDDPAACPLPASSLYAVAAFEAALKAGNKRFELHTYPNTQHGFHNDTTPRYDDAAAKLAWSRTLDFFARHLRA